MQQCRITLMQLERITAHLARSYLMHERPMMHAPSTRGQSLHYKYTVQLQGAKEHHWMSVSSSVPSPCRILAGTAKPYRKFFMAKPHVPCSPRLAIATQYCFLMWLVNQYTILIDVFWGYRKTHCQAVPKTYVCSLSLYAIAFIVSDQLFVNGKRG